MVAKELGARKIQANSIDLSGTATGGLKRIGILSGDYDKQILAQTPLGRFGQPEDIARVAVSWPPRTPDG